jgi:hypothetical protein
MNQPTAWEDGTCTARCVRTDIATATLLATPPAWKPPPVWESHSAPERGCSCGIYGALALNHLRNQYPSNSAGIIAVIAAEGTTIIGTRGLRTQYARVVGWYAGKHPERSIAARQFKDALEYTTSLGMCTAFNLPLNGPDVMDDPYSSVVSWWTA